MGKTKVLTQTGAGQHGVALATACALAGIDCAIHMGEIDIEKEYPDVSKMKIAVDMPSDKNILINLSGRGDKVADFVANTLSL